MTRAWAAILSSRNRLSPPGPPRLRKLAPDRLTPPRHQLLGLKAWPQASGLRRLPGRSGGLHLTPVPGRRVPNRTGRACHEAGQSISDIEGHQDGTSWDQSQQPGRPLSYCGQLAGSVTRAYPGARRQARGHAMKHLGALRHEDTQWIAGLTGRDSHVLSQGPFQAWHWPGLRVMMMPGAAAGSQAALQPGKQQAETAAGGHSGQWEQHGPGSSPTRTVGSDLGACRTISGRYTRPPVTFSRRRARSRPDRSSGSQIAEFWRHAARSLQRIHR